jgi:hypothetical protein
MFPAVRRGVFLTVPSPFPTYPSPAMPPRTGGPAR